MFGLSKKDKLTSAIGEFLHYNIRQALLKNEKNAGIKSVDIFTSSYIYSFIQKAAEISGYDGEKYRDKQLKSICNGIIPKSLYESILKNSLMIEIIEKKDPSSSEEILRLFHEGMKCGFNDASICVTSNNFRLKLSLYDYLIKDDQEKDPHVEPENTGESENPILQAYGFLSLVWQSWPNNETATEPNKVDFLLFRYGFVDGLSQRLSLNEEKFFELLDVFDSMNTGFTQSEIEANKVFEIISEAQKENSYPELVMIGGKTATSFDKGSDLDVLISDISKAIDPKLNLSIAVKSSVKSSGTQASLDNEKINQAENYERRIIYGPEISENEKKYVFTLSKFFVEVGDFIEKGKKFAEVETDKVIIDVASEYTGIVENFKVSIGDGINDSHPIASILVKKESNVAIRKSTDSKNSISDIEERLLIIKDFFEKGLITEEQADLKRKSLLEEL